MPKKEETSLSAHCFNVFIIGGSIGLILVFASGILKKITGAAVLQYITDFGFMILGVASIALILNIILLNIEFLIPEKEDESDILDDNKN